MAPWSLYEPLIAPRKQAVLTKRLLCMMQSGNGSTLTCLEHYDEFYGQPKLWPSSLDIDFAEAFRCESDTDCPGSFCDRQFEPPICSPKVHAQLVGDAEGFLSPPFGAGASGQSHGT